VKNTKGIKKMNQLNFMQRQYIKRLMLLCTDYINFESFGAESQIALIVMNESAISVKKLEKWTNEFISMINIQNEWNAKKLQSAK
jgi:hypothetical protein